MTKETTENRTKSIYCGIHLSFWIVAFNTVLYVVALFANGGYIIQRALVLVVVNVLLFYACYWWVVPAYIQQKRFKTAIAIIFLLAIAITFLRTVGDRILMGKFEWDPLYNFSAQGRLLVMLFGELSFAVFAILLRLAVSSYKNKRRMDELKKLQLNTELQFLKAQMNPHFLFNSINNIYSLVLLRSDKAPQALMKLSELLRYSLYDCHGKVSLWQEMEALDSYIELFKLKYEEDIRLEFVKTVGDAGYQIEPLLLVPLLENALKYSGIGHSEEAFVLLKLSVGNNGLVFQITNSKIGYSKPEEASGIGLANIRKRLQNIYPGQHVFDIIENEHKFEATLKISLR
jgi:two-component system, LytTR family, sensor kinase